MVKADLIYNSHEEKSKTVAQDYNKTLNAAYRYLAYKDLPDLLKENLKTGKALDYGCGTGLSTQFIKSLGFDVDGADVSYEMLNQAKEKLPLNNFFLIKDGKLPSISNSYEFIFSSFVLYEISSKEEIENYLLEAKRVLKKGGIFTLVVGSNQMYNGDWLVFDTDFPENKQLKSGDKAKIYLPLESIEFIDFYWSEEDCLELFQKTGFTVLKNHYPLGDDKDPFQWKEEKNKSPYVIYVLKKDN